MIIKKRKTLLKTFALVSTISLPLLIISSCSGDSIESTNTLKTLNNFLANNDPIVSSDSNFKNYPTQLYIDNETTSINTFKIADELENILTETNVSANFKYSESQPSGNRIKFDLTFTKDGKVILEENPIIEGFITRTQYITKTRESLQSISLIPELKNKYQLKEFLSTKLPAPNQPEEWKGMIDFEIPPGFIIEFNNDIKPARYDSRNQKLVIGTFSTTPGFGNSETKEDLAISITNNFISPTKPLSVFVVRDEGVSINAQNTLGINSETIFIDRTSNNIIKFSQKLNKAAIYGELDLSHFKNWELPAPNQGNNDNGVFQSNFITSVKLPKDVTELTSKLFLENKIINFDTTNTITKINSDSFDPMVVFSKALINQLGLALYYDAATKTLDFFNKPTLTTIDQLTELLQLVARGGKSLDIDKIILPGNLLKSVKGPDVSIAISIINELEITVSEVVISSSEKINIHNRLWLNKWEIAKLVIPQEIISISMDNIKKTNRLIDRTLNPDVLALVDAASGTLDLRKDISPLLNYNNNLNDYYDINNPSANKIEVLYLQNVQNPTSSGFENIFKVQLTPPGGGAAKKNKIHVSSNTPILEGTLLAPPSSLEIMREFPENLKPYFTGGHLNLEGSSVFVNDFYKNLIYVEGITSITLPVQTEIIPNRAFFNIDLSGIPIKIGGSSITESSNITEVGNSAFRNSKLKGVLNLPKVTQLGAYSFEGNFFSEANLPLVEIIGSNALANNKLITLNIDNAKTIGSSAFLCNKLTNLNLSKIEKIESFAFQNNEFTHIDLPKVTTIETNAFHTNKLVTVNLPLVSYIGPNAFGANKTLKSVTLSSKTVISKDAFDNEATINIPSQDQVNLIKGLYVDNGTKKVIDFTKVQGKRTYAEAVNQLNLLIRQKNTIIDEFIWNLDLALEQNFKQFNATNITTINKLIIQKSNNEGTTLANDLFNGIRIKEVVGLDNVNRIGDRSFFNSQIELFSGTEPGKAGELILKPHVTYLGNDAFINNKLTKVVFEPGSKAEIPSRAFFGNPNLQEVQIPATIRHVSNSAFDSKTWPKVKRAPYRPFSFEPKVAWTYNQETGEVVFNKMVLGYHGIGGPIEENIKTLNGMKINKISFQEDIYFISPYFLKGLVNIAPKMEVDFSNILVIQVNAFEDFKNIQSTSPKYEIKGINTSNIVYNDINSGISL